MTSTNDCTHTSATANNPGFSHSTNGGPEMQMGHCPDCDSEVRQVVSTGRWHLVDPDQPTDRGLAP